MLLPPWSNTCAFQCLPVGERIDGPITSISRAPWRSALISPWMTGPIRSRSSMASGPICSPGLSPGLRRPLPGLCVCGAWRRRGSSGTRSLLSTMPTRNTSSTTGMGPGRAPWMAFSVPPMSCWPAGKWWSRDTAGVAAAWRPGLRGWARTSSSPR